MFASMWKSVIRRWRRLGHLPAAGLAADLAIAPPPRPFQGRSRPDGTRISAPRSPAAKGARPLRIAESRPLQIARIKPDGRRIDQVRAATRAAPQASRPIAPAQATRRTAPARLVWLEDRTAAPRLRPATIVALPPRARRSPDRHDSIAAAA